jgi:hypothetical protein
MIWLMLTILVSLDVKGAAILASPSFTTWQTADCQYAAGQSRILNMVPLVMCSKNPYLNQNLPPGLVPIRETLALVVFTKLSICDVFP